MSDEFDAYEKPESPNSAIDRAMKKMLKDMSDEPMDVKVKVVNSAISWEKAKHGILGKKDDFDPDDL